jgi:hypothetical protein
MKHPGHTPRSPGGASDRASARTPDRAAGHERALARGPSREPSGENDGGDDGQVRDGEHPHDLLVRELDDLRSELEVLAADEPPGDIDERAETVRERYSELLDDYSDDPEALTRIRALGRRIKDLEEAGSLPRSLIRRGRSRR